MSRQPWPTPPGTLEAGSISRRQAARLLTLARQAGGEVVTEAIDWAYAAMPDRATVQRLKVRSLMRTGELEHADALLAQALLVHPTDPVLSLLRAERLLAKGRLKSAAREVELVLASQPRRPGALVLGAEIASKQGDFARAVLLLERAVEARPLETAHRLRLVEALLADGRAAQAADQLANVSNPPALLEASVLRAQGRAIDALARLQTEWSHEPKGANADRIAAAIVELLEQVGAIDELGQFVLSLDASHPRALAKAAEASLMLGRFDEAMSLGAMLLKRRAFVPIGRGVLLVAATMQGNFSLAQRVVRQLIASQLTIDRISLAELWRRGMIGRLVCAQTSLMPGKVEESSTVLGTLAQSAEDLFREQLVEAKAHADAAAAAELLHLRRQCTLQPGVEGVAEPAAMPAATVEDCVDRESAATRRAA